MRLRHELLDLSVARRIRVEGQVQGVFFRDWTVATASALGLGGWVRNRRDGTVELLAEGDAPQVAALIERLHQGPPSAQVHRVIVAEAPPEGAAGFTRRATC